MKAIQETIDENTGPDHVVIAIQECWVIRAGLFGYISREMIKLLPMVVLICIHLLGLACTLCFGCPYNPMKILDDHQCYVMQDNEIG